VYKDLRIILTAGRISMAVWGGIAAVRAVNLRNGQHIVVTEGKKWSVNKHLASDGNENIVR